MATIDLLALEPHKVSTNLNGYITYIYGAGKTGKTTLASQMDGALLFAFERGYNAIPGIIAQDITSWADFKKSVKQLKDPAVKEKFKCVVIDTVDIASDLCEKYICNQQGVESIGDIGYGKGYKLFRKELEETFRGITQLDYAVFFISHAKDKEFTRPDGSKYNQIVPTLADKTNEIFKDMADIYGYAHQVVNGDSTSVSLTLRSLDGSVDAGCRFKHMPAEVDFVYQAIADALVDAINKEAEEHDNQFVTEKNLNKALETEYDFDQLKADINNSIAKIQKNVSNEDFKNYFAPKITHIVETYLGQGHKINDATIRQAEQLSLILSDLSDLIGNTDFSQFTK